MEWDIPIMKRMASLMSEGKTLRFILPAFPAKSPSPLKVAVSTPDLGEVIALQNLNRLCEKISAVYAPGAEVVICSDGRVFSDVVNVSDELIDQYGKGVQDIITEFNLIHLKTFSLEDLYPQLTAPELRERLLWQFAKSVEEVRFKVVTEDSYRSLFNGIHRFMVEDQQGVKSEKSKNQLNKEAKHATYELMRRSDAWSSLIEHYFKDVLRLSIHPYPAQHEKFGVKLVASSSKWATPWHNVTVKTVRGFQLMHHDLALKLGARKLAMGGKYVYFEL